MPQTNSSLLQDQNHAPIQAATAFQTKDGAASPLVSPLALTGSQQTLTVPPGAIWLTLFAPVVLTISEVASGSSFVVPASTVITLGCSRMTSVFITGATVNNVEFLFQTV